MIGGVPQGADSVADPVGAAASLLFAPSRRVAAPSLGLETESSEAGSFFSVQKCSEFREVSRHSISNKCGKDSDPRDALYRGLCSCCGSYNCVKLKEERFLTRTDTPAWLSRKPALILDVDNTIVQAFSSAKQIRLESDDLRLEKCKLEASDFLDEHGLPELYTFKLTNNPDTYLLKLRPGLRTFLQKVSACFELCIYTAAAREYTNVVLAAVDPQGSLFGDRIWTKDDNPEGDNMAPKEVQNLFKKERRPAEEILVIDDRKDHWECGGRKVPHRVFQISYYSYLTRQVPALTKFYAFRPGAPHPRSSRVKFSSDSADALGEEEKSSSSSSSSSSVPARYIPEWDSEDPRVAAADADRELVYLGNLLVELYYRYTSSSHRGGVRQKSLLKVLREMRSETTAGFNILLSGFIGGKNKRDAVSRRGPSGPAAAGVTSSRQQQQQSFPSAAADAHPSEQQQQQQQHPPRVVSLPQPPGGGGTRPHPTRLSPATASPPRTSTSPDSLRLSLSASNFPFYPGAIEWIRHRTGRKRGTSRGGSDSMRRTEQSGPSRQVLMPPPPSTGGPLLHLSSDWTPSVVPHPHDRLREMGGLPITDGDPLESVSAFVARGRTHRAEQRHTIFPTERCPLGFSERLSPWSGQTVRLSAFVSVSSVLSTRHTECGRTSLSAIEATSRYVGQWGADEGAEKEKVAGR
uniref:protein-serine/threonine phosphatase n=1 Tax=Chromera velia CCMP2878 TaxID=1169474 RepID=A0A0G4H798_9ALVE|eukprot:Cvel_24903.t1-p1 / transcript=Cvel_24903.t1 / gene=Cvel_24903 / organism=Chromera_velia_CCMP2878 / gene_product=RNA polymerase II subunit A C-terminal domain, putative / transcript_product=RNA polymerase II subunit A C-terminal domain, putative / location=Cvel_scaffold2753:3948-9486(+) / protein_length=690 / sequence_SO=supercontig / SO=protein_coding / is_pseudo=false